jgi:hypothetical protein
MAHVAFGADGALDFPYSDSYLVSKPPGHGCGRLYWKYRDRFVLPKAVDNDGISGQLRFSMVHGWHGYRPLGGNSRACRVNSFDSAAVRAKVTGENPTSHDIRELARHVFEFWAMPC